LNKYKDKLERLNEDLKNGLKQLQLEYDLLQSKLDEQYIKINRANKNNINLMKNIHILNLQNEELSNRIKILENELAEKNKKFNEIGYINKNYKYKVEEQQKKIDQLNDINRNIEEQLAQQPLIVKSKIPRR